MELKAERVDQLNCGKCGQIIDPSRLRPLSTIDCPRCGKSVAVPARFGDFLLTGVLGTGAAGVVCKGLDQVLHRQVAIKILKTGDDSAELIDSCTREARALARLNHPHVVQVYNIGEYRNQHYIVMELLDGGSLEKLMIGKQSDEKDVLDIAIDVAEGLGAAARMGLVHMDVKPANILFDRQRRAKLIDFGVARFARRSNDQIIGTPYYVAPEVVRGKPANETADIYSLGATLFHLLAGRPPFEGSNVTDVIAKRLRNAAPPLHEFRPDIHAGTAQLVAHMLQADPANRHSSYDALLAEMRHARAELDLPAEQRVIGEIAIALAEPVSTTAAAPTPQPSVARLAATTTRHATVKPANRNRLYIAGAALAVVAVLGAVWFFAGRSSGPAPLAPPTEVVEPPMAPPEELDLAGLSVQIRQPEPIPLSDPWKPLKPTYINSSAGSGAKVLNDDSVLITDGPGQAGELYTIEFTIDQDKIEAIALQAMPDPGLPRNGPGRNEGLFVLAEMDIAAGSGGELKPLEVASHQASYEQQGMSAAKVFDDDLQTGWGISPHRGAEHVLVATLKNPLDNPGKTRLKIELRHHKDVAASLGRFRIWARTASPEPVMADAAKPQQPAAATPAAAPQTAAKPAAAPAKPAPAKTPAKPAPAPAKPKVPPRPEGVDFPPRYTEGVAMTDEGYWHTLDIRRIKTTSGASFTRSDNGELLGEGPDDDGVYTIVAYSPLQRITGFRLDCLQNAALEKKGPGRKGEFAISQIVITATALPDGTPTEINLTNGRSVPGSPTAGAPFSGEPDKSWPEKPSASAQQLYFDPASPLESSGGFMLTIRITHAGKLPLGCFRLSATSFEDPAKTPPTIAWQKPRHAIEFVPIPITSVTAAEGTKCEVLDDGTALLTGRPLDDIEAVAKLAIPKVTAVKLVFLPHDQIKPGPGRQLGGRFGIAELRLTCTTSSGEAQPITISQPSTDDERSTALLPRAFDQSPATAWLVQNPRGEERTLLLPLESPLAVSGPTQLTVHMKQVGVGRFQLLATSSSDPAVLAATPPPAAEAEPAKDAEPPKPTRR